MSLFMFNDKKIIYSIQGPVLYLKWKCTCKKVNCKIYNNLLDTILIKHIIIDNIVKEKCYYYIQTGQTSPSRKNKKNTFIVIMNSFIRELYV